MLELCKEASIDCILDDSDNSDTYCVVLLDFQFRSFFRPFQFVYVDIST